MSSRYPVIFAEGLSFVLAARRVFPHRKALDIGGIGHGMTASGIARRALPLIKIQLEKGCRVVLAIDRESRHSSAEDLAKAVIDALPDNFRLLVSVVVADQMMENWILADIKGITALEYINKTAKQRRYEGTHGKDELKQLFVHGFYDETTHAPQLMKKVRRKIAVKNSNSFANFVRLVSGK